ncbi:MAG: hypothetical protein ACYSUI_22545, partial [Planctomycetota bacterium]
MPAAINSKLDIMNIALVALGTRPATSPTEQRGPVQFANARYEGVRDYVLTTGNWNCATKRATLSPLATTPDFEFDNEYQLPADFLRLHRMEDLDLRFRIEGRKLLTSWDEAKIIYVYRMEVVAEMDELLKYAIGYRLAFEIALATKADT